MIPPCGSAGTCGDGFRIPHTDPPPARETDDPSEPGARVPTPRQHTDPTTERTPS